MYLQPSRSFTRTSRFLSLCIVALGTACGDRELPSGAEPQRSGGPSFSVVTPTFLGTLPGMTNSQAYAINESNQVAGYSYSFDAGLGANIGRGFIWGNGAFTDIGLPPGYNNSSAVDINDAGAVVGVVNTGNTNQRAFVWQSGVFTLIPTLGGAINAARAINNSGQVVGYSQNGAGQQRAFIYSGGVVSELAPLAGSTQCIAHGINNSGVVVGSCIVSGNRAVKWESGVATDLGSYGTGSHDTYGWSINDAGTVTGTDVDYTVNPHRDRAVIWQGAPISALQEYPDLQSSQAFGINSDGVIVGHASANSTTAPVRAVYWVNGLVDELGVPTGYAISTASGVNNSGMVAGFAENASAVSQAVVWTIPATPSAPATPANASALPVSRQRIDLSWTDASSNETLFELERRVHNGSDWSEWTARATLAAGTTSFIDPGLAENTAYEYRIRTCNTGGCSTFAVTNAARTLPRPSAPTNFTGNATSSTQIELSWTESAADETGFTIARSTRVGATWSAFVHVADLPVNSTTYTDAGVVAASGYRYRIQECVVGACSSYVTSAAILTPPVPTTAPNAPGALVATVMSASRIDLSWTDDSDNEWEFQIFRRQALDGGAFSDWQRIARVADGVTSMPDELVTGATTYRYRIRACNSIGCSDYTVSRYVTTPASIVAR